MQVWQNVQSIGGVARSGGWAWRVPEGWGELDITDAVSAIPAVFAVFAVCVVLVFRENFLRC